MAGIFPSPPSERMIELASLVLLFQSARAEHDQLVPCSDSRLTVYSLLYLVIFPVISLCTMGSAILPNLELAEMHLNFLGAATQDL